MKNIILLSLIAASMLFTACGEKTEKTTEDAPVAVQEAVKEESGSALDEAKKSLTKAAEATKAKAAQMADSAVEKAAELKTSAQESITEATAGLKEKAEQVSAATTEAIATISAPAAYAKCKGCHGVDGKTVALGKSAVIAGQDKAALITSLNEYKAGTRNVSGMGGLMKGQVATMSDADIEAIAEYLSTVK